MLVDVRHALTHKIELCLHHLAKFNWVFSELCRVRPPRVSLNGGREGPRGPDQEASALTTSCLGAPHCGHGDEGRLPLVRQEWIDVPDSSCLNENAEWITPRETKGPWSLAAHLFHQAESIAEVHPEPELVALIGGFNSPLVGGLSFIFQTCASCFKTRHLLRQLVPQLKCAGWEEMLILMWDFFVFLRMGHLLISHDASKFSDVQLTSWFAESSRVYCLRLSMWQQDI